MSNHPAPDWDPRDVSVSHDQRRGYDEMRERCPVAYDDYLGWSLFRHEDIVSVLADPETYSNASEYRAVPNGMDAPEHTRYRSVLEPYFGSEQMAALEPRCRRIAGDLVQTLLARDEVEFITEFAEPLPYKTLCTFLGWSSVSWDELLRWEHANQQQAFSGEKEAGAALAREFSGYVTDALGVHRNGRGAAGAGIIDVLAETDVDGTALSDEDIVSIVRNWTASCSTVAAALGILVFHLAEHADIQQRLRREPALLGAAIDEILRVDGPLVANHRTTTRDVEIRGRTISAGEKLTLHWIAANRDSRAFDDPQAVRIDRDPGNNLLFGAGIHNCMGAPMARLEMRVAMEELLARTSTIECSAAERLARDLYPSNGFRAMSLHLR